MLTARAVLIAMCTVSAAAMLYVGAYQLRMVEHLSCPLLKHGCEAVADAPFARPFGIPDGLIAAGTYVVLILLALFGTGTTNGVWSIRVLSILAAAANLLGVFDMARFGAWCFYCLVTTLLSPLLVWLAFLI
jgi:uncharacterized membrane protein